MLHRLSYLMYNNEEIRPRDVLVLTPSDTFNDFIDELSAVLELERVKTVTLSEYFLQVLKNEKIDLTGRISRDLKETEEYLAYVYSPRFVSDLKKSSIRYMTACTACSREKNAANLSGVFCRPVKISFPPMKP